MTRRRSDRAAARASSSQPGGGAGVGWMERGQFSLPSITTNQHTTHSHTHTFRERPQRPLHVALDDGGVGVPLGRERREGGHVVGPRPRPQQQGPRPGAQGVGAQATHDGQLAQGWEIDLGGKGEGAWYSMVRVEHASASTRWVPRHPSPAHADSIHLPVPRPGRRPPASPSPGRARTRGRRRPTWGSCRAGARGRPLCVGWGWSGEVCVW